MLKEKAHLILRRAVATLLVLVLLLSDLPVGVYANTEESSGEESGISQLSEGGAGGSSTGIVITDYNQDLIIYNYYCYLSNIGEISIGAAGYTISGSSSARSVHIGDQDVADPSDDQSPKTNDIYVELNGLSLTDGAALEARPVYGGDYRIVATVSSASALSELVLLENAKMTLNVNADTTITNLTMAGNSLLNIVVADGATLSLGNATGGGKLVISGSGTVSVSGKIEAAELEIAGVTISGNSDENTTASVTAQDSLVLRSGTIQNLALFGYADSASGSRTLTLEGGNFHNVAAVGVSESNTAVVLNVSGLNLVGLTNTNVYRDYAVSYQYNGASVAGEGWLQHYRVKYENMIDAAHASTAGSRTLPEYALAGYVFMGWQMEGGLDAIRELPAAALEGDLVLSAQMQAGEVGVTFDLGFDPSDLTSDRNAEGDLPQRSTTLASTVGAVLDLPAPQRFGYAFQGWKITTGDTRQLPKEAATATISYADLAENDGAYTLRLEAQWALDTFPIKLQPRIGFGSGLADMQISVDGGTTWETLAELAARTPNMNWDAAAETCTFVPEIEYGETLGAFFKRVFGEDSAYPILQDTRAVGSGKTRFVCWKTADGTTLQADSKYEYGNGGFLVTKAPDQTLHDYQAALKDSPVVLGSEWSSTLQYFLTTAVPDGWTVLVGGKSDASAAVPDENGRITVGAALPVYYRVARSSADRISNWMFTMSQGTDPIYPAMEPVAGGDQYLYYKFIMPNSDVTAAYMGSSGGSGGSGGSGAQPVYVDIAQSPITFAENISYRGLDGLTGFWYSKRMVKQEYDGMVVNAMTPLFYTTDMGDNSAYVPVTGTEAEDSGWYFYEFNTAIQTLYVTTQNTPTTNQLVLESDTTVEMKDCRMQLRESFLANLSGETIKYGSEYCNIVLNSSSQKIIKLTLIVDGKNTLGALAQSVKRNSYMDAVVIKGKSSDAAVDSLTLGLIYGWISSTIDYVTIDQDTDCPNDYFYYCTGAVVIKNSVLNCKDKLFYGGFNSGSTIPSISGSTVYVKKLYIYSYLVTIKNRSYVHVYGDVSVSNGFECTNNSSLLVEGNLSARAAVAYHARVSDSYALIRGYCQVNALQVNDGGVLIANLVSDVKGGAAKTQIGGGKIITNLFSNAVTGIVEQAAANGDDYPFKYYESRGVGGSYNYDLYSKHFIGGTIYSFGQYVIDSNRSVSVAEADRGAVVKEIIDAFLDDNGELQEQYRYGTNNEPECISDSYLQNQIKTMPYSGKPGFVMGRSDMDYTNYFKGTNLYVNGDIDLRYISRISAGDIWCSGTLSCKKDLYITGGTVTAKEVGNQIDLTTTENGITRYQVVSIQGENTTVNTDRLGRVSKELTTAQKTYENHGTVVLDGSAEIHPFTQGNTISVIQDEYMNYFLDGMTLEPGKSNPEYLRFSGTAAEGKTALADISNWKLCKTGEEVPASTAVVFAKPYDGESPVDWAIASVSGPNTTRCELDGTLHNGYRAPDQSSVSLYAVKTGYDLIVSEGYDQIQSVTYYRSETDRISVIPSQDGVSYSVYTGGSSTQVVVTLKDTAMMDKTVIFYYDATGIMRNVLPEVNRENRTFTFTMPKNATEIHVADSLEIYIDQFEMCFYNQGFCTMYDYEEGSDRTFLYGGNVVLKTAGTTGSRVHFLSNFDNTEDNSAHQVTYSGISQKIEISVRGNDNGTILDPGAKVRLGIRGTNTVDQFNCSSKQSAPGQLTLVGEDKRNDILNKTAQPGNNPLISANYTTINCENINFKAGRVYIVSYGGQVILTNCDKSQASGVTVSGFSSDNSLADIQINNCILDLDSESLKGKTLAVNNSELHYKGNSPIFQTITENVVLDSSTVNYYSDNPCSNRIISSKIIPNSITLKNSSSITAAKQLTAGALRVEDNSSITVSDPGGIILCPELVLDGENASVTATTIALSGFYNYCPTSSTEKEFLDKVQNQYTDSNFTKSGKLVLNKGTVTVDCIGSCENTDIIINGGTLNANTIGKTDQVYGFAETMGDKIVLSASRISTSSNITVSVNGGTVNVTANGYLGGINATVNQSGGTVNLADGAVLGMTEEQKTALADSYSAAGGSIANHTATNINVAVTGGAVSGAGSISAPYGNISISEADGSNTQVSVKNCTAESGVITIRNASDGLTNPYSSGETSVSPVVGVIVTGELFGRELHILDGAAVYAGKAYSSAGAEENGILEISEDPTGAERHTALYTGDYFGMMGSGSVVYTTVHPAAAGGYQQNVYGTRRVRIHYELCDDAIDPATNPAENVDGFTVGSFSESNYLFQLQDPIRYGFDFQGWYEQEDYSGERITQIRTTNTRDIVLYAKWTPRLIPFSVSVSTEQIADLITANETAGLDGTLNVGEGIFTFATPVYVPYRSVLIGTANTSNQVHLVNYRLASYSVTEMVWKRGDTQSMLSSGTTTVSRDMVAAYDEDHQPLTLFVSSSAKRRLLLTMDLNLKNGLPKDAEFNNITPPNQSIGTTISSYADFGKTYGDAAGFAGSDASLIVPTAPGYSFKEWNTKADGSGETITANIQIFNNSAARLYAIWEANPYKLVFDAGEGSVITAGSDAPTGSDTQQTLAGTVVYDKKIDGNIRYEGESTGAKLPHAWKKGYVFLGWSFGDAADPVDLTTAMKLNLTDISCLDLDADTALTLRAVYRKIRVTYVPKGGTWQGDPYGTGKATVTVDAPDYGEALAGYVKNAATDDAENYVLTGTVSDGSVCYAAYSTTIGGYSSGEQHGYVENDYRGTILRKGYTFFGWYTTPGAAQDAAEQDTGNGFFPNSYPNAVGTVPEYEDITLYASWKPNQYSLTLYASKEGVNDGYSDFHQASSIPSGQTIPLRISDEVAGTYITDGNIRWPARSEWYASNKGDASASSDENARRYLLGFTFDPLDPGDSRSESTGYGTYRTYANIVTRLIQKDALFFKQEGDTQGAIFHLPEDVDYGNTAISGTTSVPDYPTGYTIPLYAVYRERSLVFVEYVVDAAGNPSKTVLASYPYNDYVDYPTEYQNSKSYSELTASGYKLLKWGVNSYGIGADVYPSDAAAYEVNKENYKSIATSMGAFDINVYTIYAAQVTDTAQKRLTANGDPTADNVSTYTYKLPMSMQNGVIKYQLLANDGSAYDGFELVTREQLRENRYSPDYSAKIALTMQILDAGGDAVGGEVDLVSSDQPTLFSTTSIGAGYSIRLRMYHSLVMTEDAVKPISLKCSFFRDSTEGGEDMQQFFWLKNIRTELTASMYTVVYDANLPADLTVVEWNGFSSDSGSLGKRTTTVAYGGNLLDVSPVVEGYTAVTTWTRTKEDGTPYQGSDQSIAYGAALTLPVCEDDNGTIHLKGAYQVNSYQLKISTDVFDKWTVKIDGTEVTERLWNLVAGGKTVSINYHQTVTLTGKTAEEPAEFIQLVRNGGGSLGELDLYATQGEGNTYSFRMPDHSMDVSYQNVRTLYLEDGRINLTRSSSADGYQQEGQTFRTWRGGYQILMDHDNNADGSPTNNRLVIDGDFSGRDISLGNLNIQAVDSIELKSGTTAALKTSAIQAKNIAIPSGASLTMQASSGTSDITLTPDVGYAAIGGHDSANGAITLDHLKLALTLPAGSAASGIGAGNQEASLVSCGNISLNNCQVVVDEKSTASSAYQGSWIGGTGVPNVTIQNTMLTKNEGSGSMSGPFVLKGASIVVSGSKIGSDETPVTDPIYAASSLAFSGSVIRQRFEIPLGSTAAFGTGSDGTVSVQGSSIVTEFPGSGSSDKLYSGTMKLMDKSSHVVVDGIQIMDVNNGTITIDLSGTAQDGAALAHTGSYLLLSEFDTYSGQSDLIVNGLVGSAQVQINAMTLRNLTANCDTPLRLNGNMTITGNTTIAEGKTLYVAADDDTVSMGGFGGGKGNYRQSGGTLTGSSDLIVGGNLTLERVTADLPGKKLGSSGAAGVTTVLIQDSTVTAADMGALGAQNTSFTFVELNGTNTMTGNLIQDHYRIAYDLNDTNYHADDLPTVLRSTTRASGVPAYTPRIPDAPQCTGTSFFRNWYITRQDGVNVVLSDTDVTGFAEKGTLDASFLAYAVDTDPNDGTKTLIVHAWMGLEGKAAIQSGGTFADMGSVTGTSLTSASVVNNGQWTARFEIQGTVIAGSKYQFEFENALPQGTKLTLCDRSGDTLKWYYCIVRNEAVTSVTSDSFIEMGSSTETAELPAGAEGSVLADTLQLMVDFSDAASPAVDNTLHVNLLVDEQILAVSGTNLSYSTVQPASAAITANVSQGTDGSAAVTVTPLSDTRLNGKKLYVIAEIKDSATDAWISVPYGASATFGGVTGTWIDGSIVAFELGDYAALDNVVYNWSISGLRDGNYSVTWYLTAASSGSKNPFEQVLAEGAPVTIEQEAVLAPSMTAVLTDIDGDAPAGQALEKGSSHTVTFAVETNQAGVEYFIEKQTALKSFSRIPGSDSTVSGSTVTVTIPGGAGTYRVRFSINNHCDWDDVYYTFIVR